MALLVDQGPARKQAGLRWREGGGLPSKPVSVVIVPQGTLSRREKHKGPEIKLFLPLLHISPRGGDVRERNLNLGTGSAKPNGLSPGSGAIAEWPHWGDTGFVREGSDWGGGGQVPTTVKGCCGMRWGDLAPVLFSSHNPVVLDVCRGARFILFLSGGWVWCKIFLD